MIHGAPRRPWRGATPARLAGSSRTHCLPTTKGTSHAATSAPTRGPCDGRRRAPPTGRLHGDPRWGELRQRWPERANIASLVQADQKTTIDDVQKSLGNPTVKPDTKLCYVTRTLANEFWGFERDGFEAEAQKLGVQYQTFAVNDEASITEQLDKAQSALNQGCTALLASPISATALDSVFTSALAKGVPAIVLNDAKSTLPGVVYVGPDAEAIGQSAADYIAQQLPDGGKVAMIEGDPGSSNALNRGKGFKEGLTKHPNLNLVASQTAKWDTNQAQTIATAMLTANPDIKAFYSQNDTMAFGVQAAVDAKGLTGKVIIVGTDGIPQAKKQIAAGTSPPP